LPTHPTERAPLSFSQVVLAGSAAAVRPLLARLCADAGKCGVFWFNDEAGIEDDEDIAAKVADFLHLAPHAVHLVAGDDLVHLLHAQGDDDDVAGKVLASAPIRSASFRLDYRVFSAAQDRDIQLLLHDLPSGLRIADESHAVQVDPQARGVEVYTPAHDYEAHGAATISGRVDLVIAKRRQLLEHEAIQAHRIELDLAPA
jgi:hypothetical protein